MQRLRSGLACCLLVATAQAAPPQWGGSVTVASDYLLRGVSFSGNDPALSSEVHVQFSGNFFASAGVITSRPQPAADMTPELNATLGFAAPLNEDWIGRVSVAHYEAPWSAYPDFYRYDELTADLTWRDRWHLLVSYSPNTSRYAPGYGPVWHGNALGFETSYQQPLRHGLQAFAGIGYYDLSDLFGDGYWYGSFGVTLSRQQWEFDLSWVMPEATAQRLSYPGTAQQRLLATLTWNF
ncbi:MAG: TorF family putative porin [Pseudomonadota bacterium]